MKRVGFIDYYLDEWHANNYPETVSYTHLLKMRYPRK